MPTGYTAGILDGDIKTFKEFAGLCTRQFLYHLRDEPMSSGYKPMTISDYHIDSINEAKNLIKELKSLSDEQLINREKSSIKKDIKRAEERILKIRRDSRLLDQFLNKAKSYVPATEDHENIAKFMIDQLKDTIDYDCDDKYSCEELLSLESRLITLDVIEIRTRLMASAEGDVDYHTSQHELEVKKCKEFNDWYNQFIDSLE